MRRRATLLSLASLGLSAACREAGVTLPDGGTPRPPPPPAPTGRRTVLLGQIPHVKQKPDFCGEACVEMVARHLGRTYDQDAVFGASGVDPALGRGVVTRELARAAATMGFEVGDVWYRAAAASPQAELASAFEAILLDLEAGTPTIVCTRFDERPDTTEHFRLVVGFDVEEDSVVYHEPAAEEGAFQRMSRARFLDLWPLRYEASTWTLVRLRMKPSRLVDPPRRAAGFQPADYAQHVLALKERLAGLRLGSLSIRIEEPFVVLGDDTAEVLAERAKTVRWAADLLEKDFFRVRPKKILNVFLFGGAPSYERGVRALTGGSPGTPYGFYSGTHGGLFMNIATGGGTLVHEIVHPYVEADFEDAPAWLNEGLGSLFEQCGEHEGHIVGYTNWRLAGLQRAIHRGAVPSFRELTHMSDHVFYEEDRGTNYGQARYLMFYLQERGLLRPFYRAFRDAKAADPTGFATLQATLEEADMAGFQRRWEQYVLGLRFPA